MRKFRFRMWDGKKYFTDPWQVMECLKQQTTGEYDHNADGSVFEQFIGRGDAQGIDIFENDIVRTDEGGWIARVVYNYDGFMLTDDRGGFSYSPAWKNCTVIGNIHLNADLLGGSNVTESLDRLFKEEKYGA